MINVTTTSEEVLKFSIPPWLASLLTGQTLNPQYFARNYAGSESLCCRNVVSQFCLGVIYSQTNYTIE